MRNIRASPKVTEVSLRRRAYADLERIWRYIAQDSRSAADRWALVINEKIDGLATFPEMGAPHDEILEGARLLTHGRYLIIYLYSAERDVADVLTIVEGERDLTELF